MWCGGLCLPELRCEQSGF